MSKHFKLVFFVRFFGYLVFLTGILGIAFVFGPLIQAEFHYRADKILGIQRTVTQVVTSQEVSQGGGSSFGEVKPTENAIVPVSTDYGIVIEKINANAKVVPNINPAVEREYTVALAQGVAEAAGSTKPGEKGNLYLFSHSTDAPWNIVRYNAIFYLLRELEAGDKVIIFYKNKRYDYIVFDKTVTDPGDVTYLTNRYDAPVLTLQTCDPPGTLFKRLIVRAKLAGS